MFVHVIITVLWYHFFPDIWVGNVPVSMKFVKIIDKDLTTDLIICIDISSCPCAVLMLRALTIFNINSSLKQNVKGLAVEIYCGELGAVLLLTRGVNFEANKLLTLSCIML